MEANRQRVIIMGASSGIGRELALIYIERGYRVGLAARRLAELEALRALAPERVEIARIDVTHAEAPSELAELIDRLGGMDVYIHSSGVGQQNPALDPQPERWTTEVNVVGFTALVDYAFGYCAGRGKGQIVAISSIAGTRGLGAAPAYSASKAYQATYLQSLRQLTAIRGLEGITITDIRPGFVATPLLSGKPMPMLMDAERVARSIYRAICARRSIRIIDWRYRLLVGLWRLIPRPLWERLPVR